MRPSFQVPMRTSSCSDEIARHLEARDARILVDVRDLRETDRMACIAPDDAEAELRLRLKRADDERPDDKTTQLH